jgi:hypothetical protein
MELTWKHVFCKPAGIEWMLPWMPLMLLMTSGPADAAIAAILLIAVPAMAVLLRRDARRRPLRSWRSVAIEGAIWTAVFAISALLLPLGWLDAALFALAMTAWVWVARGGRRDENEGAN